MIYEVILGESPVTTTFDGGVCQTALEKRSVC
jgi:hypothetical protein